MRAHLIWLFLFISFPAAAQTGLSAEIAAGGLEATRARLAAMPAPTEAERFGLGSVTFLRAIERTLQARWRVGMNSSDSELPVLRLPVPPNPNPEPFTPDFVAALFAEVSADMDIARAALAAVPAGSDFGVELTLGDLWFDIDGDGARGDGEALVQVAGGALLGPGMAPAGIEAVVIRFDAADAIWLEAYTHFLSGVSAAVLAYDPTNAIATVLDTGRSLQALDTDLPPANAMDMEFGFYVDRFAMVWHALAAEPDAERAAEAHGHFLAMIGANRRFWVAARAETDNDREWLPNDDQQAALGFEVPQGTGEVWLDVLGDAEAMLKGEKLIPYWRLDGGAGLNLKRMFLEPRAVNLVDWLQGAGALPYAEKGPRVTAQNFRRFEQLFRGDALMFMVFLN